MGTGACPAASHTPRSPCKAGPALPASPSAGAQWALRPAHVLLTRVLHCPVGLHSQTHTKAAVKLPRMLRWGTPAWRASESRGAAPCPLPQQAPGPGCGRWQARVEPPGRDGDGAPGTSRCAATLPGAQTGPASDSNGRRDPPGCTATLSSCRPVEPLDTGDWLLPSASWLLPAGAWKRCPPELLNQALLAILAHEH